MFVQVIQGQVSDAERVRSRFEQWQGELADGAAGWEGTTAGVTDDGRFIALVRFDSEEAARQNSSRSEQTSWWEETRGLFSGEPQFHDSTWVDVDTQGDPGSTGFVQVMQGRSSDPQRARELMTDDTVDWGTYRPDVLRTMSVEHDGDAWTMAIYFTSESEAREGERKEPPPEMQRLMEELSTLSVGETTYFDLRDPWLYAPPSPEGLGVQGH